MSIVMGYVVNNYSTTGQVQVRRFGYDDQNQDSTNLPWVYPSQGTSHMGVAGIGKNHALQPGCRVAMLEMGGPDGSLIAVGTMNRMGSAQSSSSGGFDQATSWTTVNTQQTDYAIPLSNAGAPNGIRAIAKQPSSEYYTPGNGKPYDPSQNQYPTTSFHTNGQ
jgi:hypothetical protein